MLFLGLGVAVGCRKVRANLSTPFGRYGSSLSSSRHPYTFLASNMTLLVAPMSSPTQGARLRVRHGGFVLTAI